MNRVISEREYKLFTPGPVNIPKRVSAAAALGCYHHRTPEFSSVLMDTLERLKPLFGTKEQVLPVHATGRGALEGVYNNVFTKEDMVVSIVNGSFGEMAAKTLECIEVPYITCFPGWETKVDLDELEKLIIANKATGITAVFNDTSNGVVNPVSEIGKLALKYGLMFVVDNVSALACMPFQMDDWGVDAVVAASQKGLMSPTGISFVAMSPKATAACEANSKSNFYINFSSIRKNLEEKHETPGSTPVSLVMSVNEALNMIGEEGVENTFRRHHALSLGTKSALEALGFSLYPQNCEIRSDSLTVAKVPDGLVPAKIVAIMRDKYGLLIGNGLGDTAKFNLRIAHMGYCYVEDMLQCIVALEATLFEMGAINAIGKGVSSFLDAYNNTI